VQAFLILPFHNAQAVPMAINYGVIAHEFSHRVFNKRVYRGQSIPTPLVNWQAFLTAEPQRNLLKALDEGLADWNAFGATCLSPFGCDARFLAPSVSAEQADRRDMSMNKCLTAELRNSLNSLGLSEFMRLGLEYELGTVIASALYHASVPTQKTAVLQKAVLATYTDPDPNANSLERLVMENVNTPYNFNMTVVADAILAHIPDLDLRTETCNQFLDRLKLPKEALPSCPPAAAGGTACPALSPFALPP
jgi:hypothetical protein